MLGSLVERLVDSSIKIIHFDKIRISKWSNYIYAQLGLSMDMWKDSAWTHSPKLVYYALSIFQTSFVNDKGSSWKKTRQMHFYILLEHIYVFCYPS